MRRSSIARNFFSTFYARRREILRWLVLLGACLIVAATTLLLLSAILDAPLAAATAIATGVAVRLLGQTLNLKQLRQSDKPAELATFEFDGEKILCNIDERQILRYTSAWKWRILAALTSAGACLAVQHLPVPVFHLLPAASFGNFPGLASLIGGCAAALPVYTAIFFLQVKGPERRWAAEAAAVIDKRAAASSDRLLQPRELAGLAAGVEALWHALGLPEREEYRAAAARYIGDNTPKAALQPETAEKFLDALTELARQDLRDLTTSLDAYRGVECRYRAVQMLAAAIRQPDRELKLDELGSELDYLLRLASERQWEELQRRAVWIENELDQLHESLRLHSSSVPPVVLAPGSDPYSLLGVSVDTPTPLIRKLRLSLAQLYHPDISHSTRNSAKMAELNAAYDAVMRDREREAR
jgi:hypothetical protein